VDRRQRGDGDAVLLQSLLIAHLMEGRTADNQPAAARQRGQRLAGEREGKVEGKIQQHGVVRALADGIRMALAVQQNRLEIEDAAGGNAGSSRSHEDNFAGRGGGSGGALRARCAEGQCFCRTSAPKSPVVRRSAATAKAPIAMAISRSAPKA
jgi:hypothetical protein